MASGSHGHPKNARATVPITIDVVPVHSCASVVTWADVVGVCCSKLMIERLGGGVIGARGGGYSFRRE
ncbi:hypothetical protein GCM10010278_06280 [Streptomyces melanogenes]|nr:hypothetical protein GCM10010278_06280 [Streptomyces melanogenes]